MWLVDVGIRVDSLDGLALAEMVAKVAAGGLMACLRWVWARRRITRRRDTWMTWQTLIGTAPSEVMSATAGVGPMFAARPIGVARSDLGNLQAVRAWGDRGLSGVRARLRHGCVLAVRGGLAWGRCGALASPARTVLMCLGV